MSVGLVEHQKATYFCLGSSLFTVLVALLRFWVMRKSPRTPCMLACDVQFGIALTIITTLRIIDQFDLAREGSIRRVENREENVVATFLTTSLLKRRNAAYHIHVLIIWLLKGEFSASLYHRNDPLVFGWLLWQARLFRFIGTLSQMMASKSCDLPCIWQRWCWLYLFSRILW